MDLLERIQHGWNAFMNRDPTRTYGYHEPYGHSYAAHRTVRMPGTEQSILTSMFNRIAVDVASLTIVHCKIDEEGRYLETINSGLNDCLTHESNIDQAARDFIQDAAFSMLEEGVVAIVPVDTTMNPKLTTAFDVKTMRTGRIVDWYPKKVKINVYNDQTGEREDIIMPKNRVAIIQNPLYEVVNKPNSTFQRLKRKLNLLDTIDEHNSSEKLDLIIQLPYSTRSQLRKNQAEDRRKEIEVQLSSSKYGIAYIDGTEHVTQLNRAVENNMLKQVEYLMNLGYSQLGINQSVMDGTANEETMLNYHSRIVEPCISAIVDAMKRVFISKTARTQGHTIMFFRDPFKLVPVNSLAEVADKFTRNEILSKNEVRQIIGRKPSKDPKADQLINSNISQPNATPQKAAEEPVDKDVKESGEGGKDQNGEV